MSALCAARAAEAPFGGGIAQQVPLLLARYAEQGDFHLPSLSEAQFDALAAGEAIVTLDREPAAGPGDELHAMRVVSWQLVQAPRLLVWLSLLGGNPSSSARLHDAVLARRPAGAYVSYNHIDLPWPLKDRHWVLLCDENSSLASATHDDIWEHRWSLVALDDELLGAAYEGARIAGLSRKAFDDSVYLTANRGAWIVFDLGAAGTLVAASIDVDFGGHLPETLVRTFAKRQMKAFFESVNALPGALYAASPAIPDGHGVLIAEEAARRAARYWADQPLVTASATTGNR